MKSVKDTNRTSSPIFIVSAARTPVGSFQGGLAQTPAPKLGAQAISAALSRADLKPEVVSECIMGQVLTAGAGQAPARQAAIYAGLPTSVPCLTINKVCGSGLKAVMLGADSIQLERSEIVVAGGQENMSLAPHLLENSRAGFRMGEVSMADSMIKDGLWDPYNDWHMGNAAELCVKEHHFSRQEQDAFAIESYTRAQAAIKSGSFKDEIVPVEVPGKKGNLQIDTDEEPGKALFDKIPSLRPAFEKEGTITAANASKINDGAAALVLASERAVKNHGLKPMARIVGMATHAQDPKWFTTAPIGAIQKVLELTDIPIGEIDWFEINEAFAAVTMAAIKDLKLDPAKVNRAGGAVALGHPIGASGARLLTTLVYGLRRQHLRYGLVTLCIGGGEAVAVVVERM